MKRAKLPFSDWSWDQIVLILGPVLLSIVLVVLYAGGLLPLDWPALLVVVAAVNVAGDLVFALKSERNVKRGRVSLCNDMVGSRAVAESSFVGDGTYQGLVTVAGERWRAVSDHYVDAGDRVRVVARRGLVLEVVPDTSQDPRGGPEAGG